MLIVTIGKSRHNYTNFIHLGSSGLFVIGDPAGESSRPSSRVSNQSYQTGTSNRSSAGLLPYNTGYGFETWNWLWIHYILTVTAFTAAIVFLSVAIGKCITVEPSIQEHQTLYSVR